MNKILGGTVNTTDNQHTAQVTAVETAPSAQGEQKQLAAHQYAVDLRENTAIQKVIVVVNAVIQAKLIKMAKVANDVRHIQERIHVVNVQLASKANNKVQNVKRAKLVKLAQPVVGIIHIVPNEMARILVIQEIHVIRVHAIQTMQVAMKLPITVARVLITVRWHVITTAIKRCNLI